MECIVVLQGLSAPNVQALPPYRLALALEGTLIKESNTGDTVLVDFDKALRKVGARGDLNNSVQWVPRNQCNIVGG